MKPVIIPTRHDDPAWFLFCRLDEAAPFLAFACLGVIFKHFIYGIIIGLTFSYLYKRYNAKFPKGFVLHWAYGKGLYLFSLTRTLNNPFNKRLVTAVIKPHAENDVVREFFNSQTHKKEK